MSFVDMLSRPYWEREAAIKAAAVEADLMQGDGAHLTSPRPEGLRSCLGFECSGV